MPLKSRPNRLLVNGLVRCVAIRIEEIVAADQLAKHRHAYELAAVLRHMPRLIL